MSSLKSQFFASNITKITQRITPIQWLILTALTLILIFTVLPGYIAGKWSWSTPPQVNHIKQLVKLQKKGINPPEWKILKQQTIPIGAGKWSVQIAEVPDHDPFTLLLLPQVYYLNQPIIDWLDINGIERWETDSKQTLDFQTDSSPPAKVSARFFRAWNQQTYAVVQWYSWPYGGNGSPSHWFWKDQKAQISRQRVPWVAVCLVVPIEPLSNLKDNQSFVLSLAKSVQTELDSQVFKITNPLNSP